MIPVPEQVLETLAGGLGVEAQALAFFGGGGESSDGVVYRFPHAGGERLMKVVAWPAEAGGAAMRRMQERLKFVHYLGEQGVQIVYPLETPGGLFASCAAGQHTFIAYLMDKASGSHLKPEEWSERFFENFGRTVGGLHHAARAYPIHTGVVDEASGQTLLSWQEEWQFFVEMIREAEVLERWQSIRARLEQLPIRRDTHGFLHNDPHTYNILVEGERITLLDFDVANCHWFAMDIAIAMQEMLFDVTGGIEKPVHTPAPLRPTLDAFMRGYRSQNDLDDFWLSQLDLFISYRRILLWAVLPELINSRPELKASWHAMILNEPPVFSTVI